MNASDASPDRPDDTGPCVSPAEASALSPATRLARADGFLCGHTGAITPPIHPSTSFARNADSYAQISGRGYSRDENPGFELVEEILAGLEGGAESRLFASGMAAITALVQALTPGDHVIADQGMYFGTPKLLRDWAEPWGVQVSFIDTTNLDAVSAALRPGQTRLVMLETPSNPLWRVSDIAATAELAHGVGAKLLVDNTAATPLLTQPISLGADLVVHSATKYLNGHSDVLAGALVTANGDDPLWQRVNYLRYLAGAVMGPFEAWLLQRGMRTLHLRVARQCENALAIAEALSGHPRVEAVLYPGLPSSPGHALASRQMRGGFGGMLSILVAGGEEAALETIKRCRIWTRATSLGGVESLIEHRYTVEGTAGLAPPNLLRLSAGIEGQQDLIADLLAALG